MSNVPSLPQLKRELEDLLLDLTFLGKALQRLRELLPDTSEKRATVLVLIGRLNDANKKSLRGAIDDRTLQIEYNAIRSDLSDLINNLETSDFDPTAPVPAPDEHGGSPKQGNVLYRIPHAMPLGQETECIVRIALSEDAIVEEIVLDKEVVLKSLTRVSDLMQVELTDPAKNPVFNIRSTSAAQQLITEEGFTQWFFYVEPLQPGTHTLEVKVCVLEMAFNQIARKEIVFRETVAILTEGQTVRSEETTFKNAGASLRFGGEAASLINDISQPSFSHSTIDIPKMIEQSEAAPSVSSNKGLRALAFMLAFLVLGSSATWALTPADTRDWWVASLKDTPEAYAGFIAKHPESAYAEKAFYLRAERTQYLADLRAYQQRYPNGKYRTQIASRVSDLEGRSLDQVKREPNRENIRRFVTEFPETERYQELKLAAESRTEARKELLADVEEVYVKAVQRDPSMEKVKAYLSDFPEHQRLEEVHAAAKTKPDVMAKVQSELEEAYLEKMEKEPTVKQAQEFLEKFPEPKKKEKFEDILDKKPQVKREAIRKMREAEAMKKE
ncbi:MAG: hypothetical protein JNJ57_18720 [Saprospiraceae bacterium]|nr:hypothetical protein [Saprospiraceae bacterium]